MCEHRIEKRRYMLTNTELTAQRRLSQYGTLNAEINQLHERLFNLRSSSMKTTGGNMDGMPHGANRTAAAGYESTIDRVILLENKINRKQDEFYSLKIDLNNRINSIKDKQLRKLLRLKYMSNKLFTWQDIGNYIKSSSHMAKCRLHYEALKLFSQYVV